MFLQEWLQDTFESFTRDVIGSGPLSHTPGKFPTFQALHPPDVLMISRLFVTGLDLVEDSMVFLPVMPASPAEENTLVPTQVMCAVGTSLPHLYPHLA